MDPVVLLVKRQQPVRGFWQEDSKKSYNFDTSNKNIKEKVWTEKVDEI